jgi:hypothetical protein
VTHLLILATFLVRAEESWAPVLLGGLIPIIGLGALGYLIVRAVRDNDESDE